MGVLQMAIPTVSRYTALKYPLRRLPRVPAQPVTQRAEILQVQQQINPSPAPRGTLLPPTKSLEAKLERTPQQDAAQEAAQEALAKLVRQCMAGDSQSWQQLVASQHRRIYAICYRFTGSGTDAEDLTQEVFLKLYKNLSSFDTQKGSFQTWITTLARNLLVDHFRRTRLERASDSLDATFDGEEDGPTMADRLADPRPSQEHHVAGLELKVRVQHALKQLSPELREAVILRDLEDMDYKEISQVLRIPEGTVKSRISRGRGELARLLQRIES
ncbi:RNA polymerase sigma factor [Tunturiibacter empetritectus]|uniref:RNA polymerase sigma-70 factor (ECF subfamily) n=1 Tax=Tunturiibacter lichenicola TaxID=2051959 RepID=A0A852VKF4_9BACT|nr:RNA polymerase sigma factor [Edaphobacter lichenicola]NYF90914.1 RNA polymerase sigma-70 factor (ECF subfamily) [Edaphobacter lichenicola]